MKGRKRKGDKNHISKIHGMENGVRFSAEKLSNESAQEVHVCVVYQKGHTD